MYINWNNVYTYQQVDIIHICTRLPHQHVCIHIPVHAACVYKLIANLVNPRVNWLCM